MAQASSNCFLMLSRFVEEVSYIQDSARERHLAERMLESGEKMIDICRRKELVKLLKETLMNRLMKIGICFLSVFFFFFGINC